MSDQPDESTRECNECKNSAQVVHPLKPRDAERYWSKVDRRDPDECWLWQAYTDRDGYGRFSLQGRKERAHRVAVRLDGCDPSGQVVRHSCDNPSCVNPDHLQVGSQHDNMRDMVERERQPLGERNGRSQLSLEEVKIILKATGSTADLAKRFDTSPSNIREIRSGRSWRHVE